MSEKSYWFILVLSVGLATYAMRLSFVLLQHRIKMPDWLRKALRFVPPAALSALIFPAVLRGDDMVMDWMNPRLIAIFLAAFVAWKSGNILLTLLFGMGCLWLLQWLLPIG